MLTICIPTYKRPQILAKSLRSWYQEALNLGVEILISNNDITDNLPAILKESSINTSEIRISANKENLGFHGNLYQLIVNCKTRFALFLSDEDTIIPDGLISLISILNENTEISVVLSNVLRDNGKPYYAFKDKIYKKPKNVLLDLYCRHQYMSGLVINCQLLNLDWARLLVKEKSAYMHQALVLDLFFKGNVCTRSNALVKMGTKDRVGGLGVKPEIYGVEARLSQLESMVRYLIQYNIKGFLYLRISCILNSLFIQMLPLAHKRFGNVSTPRKLWDLMRMKHVNLYQAIIFRLLLLPFYSKGYRAAKLRN